MRWYLPNIARFPSVDPITAQYPWYTPYQFAGNKPINSVDLDGLEEWTVIWSPIPINGPYASQEAAENSIWTQVGRPFLTTITYSYSSEKILQTGYELHGDMTPILRVNATTANNETIEIIMMRAGLDKDTDGNTPVKFRAPGDQRTLSQRPYLDASAFSYGTVPHLLRDHEELEAIERTLDRPTPLFNRGDVDYNVNMGAYQIITGQHVRTGLEKAVPTRVADDSGNHGGEAALYTVWQFGHGSRKNPQPTSSPPRLGQYQHWYFAGTNAPTNQTELTNSHQTLKYMQLLYIVRAALEAHNSNNQVRDNCKVEESCH